MAGGRPEIVTAYLGWLALSGPSANTVQSYGRTLASLDGWLTAGYGIGLLDATQGHLIAWRQSLTCCDVSARQYMIAVRGFYRWGRREGLRTADPAEAIPVPSQRKGVPRPVAEDDMIRAIMLAPRRIRPWLVLAGYQGLRCRAIAYLRREDLLDTMRPRRLLISPEGSKGGDPKTMHLADQVWDELVAYGLPRRRGYLFLRADGTGPNTPKRLSQCANAYLRDIDLDVTMHQFRHRFATIALQKTHDLQAVQAVMGHDSIASTQVYTQLLDEAAIAAVQAAQPPRRGLRAAGDESS